MKNKIICCMGKNIKKILNDIPDGVKASITFFLANVITAGIAYITTPLYTRLLTAEEFGQVSVFLTWFQLLGIIAMFNLSAGVFNNGMVDYPTKRNEYSFSLLILSNIITLIFMLPIILFYVKIKIWIGMEIKYLYLMMALFLLQPAYSFWAAKLRYELKYKPILCWTIICALVAPISSLYLLYNTEFDKVFSRIFGSYGILLIIYLGFYVYIYIKSGGRLEVIFWKEALKFSIPLLPHYLSTYLLNSCDKLMISNLIGDTATAYYSIAYSVGTIGIVVWTAINSSLVPYTYEKCKVDDYTSIANITKPILLLFGVVSVLIILFAPEVVHIMAPPKYYECIFVIPPIIAGVFFQIQYFIYANIVFYHKKTKYVMYASVSATILNLILNFFCIKEWGYIAAGYTTLISYMIQAMLDYFAMKKVVRKKVYDMKFIVSLSLVIVIIAVLSTILYRLQNFIRYGLIIAIFLVCLIQKEKIVYLFKKFNKVD